MTNNTEQGKSIVINKSRSIPDAFWVTGMIIGFVLWSWRFIYESSFITIDRYRSYSLFDDAMISMRYAWNFSHGFGLVWNQGDFVQGYTNLLTVLMMSLVTFVLSRTMAVLAMQILGVFFILAIAYLNMKIAEVVFPREANGRGSMFLLLSFLCGIVYYPLAYWSLMGMETGLLSMLLLAAILFVFKYVRSFNSKFLYLAAVCGGLMFLTRNDSAIFSLTLWAYVALIGDLNNRKRLFWSQYLVMLGLYFAFVFGQLGFQYLYYGDVLPNTYILKLTGMPLFDRVQNGLGFVLPYLKETVFVFLAAITGLFIGMRREKVLMFFLVCVSVLYQVYVGGDPWNYWRIMAPTMPLLLMLCVDAAFDLPHIPLIKNKLSSDLLANGLGLILIFFCIISINARFLPEISFQIKPYQVNRNARNVNVAIVLNEVLKEDATVGVFWAGTIPYYLDNVAVDFLGKSDRYIAKLPPDMSGSVSFNGMISVPGHNKYDLTYSIVQLKPTYVAKLFFGNQEVFSLVGDEYVNVKYRYTVLTLLRDSPDVNWAKLNLP